MCCVPPWRRLEQPILAPRHQFSSLEIQVVTKFLALQGGSPSRWGGVEQDRHLGESQVAVSNSPGR